MPIIVKEIWSDWWNGKGDDRLIFPEASYKHHILTDWGNDNYGDDNYDWSKIGQLNYNFKDYYDELTDNWNFNDDRDGNWTIITDETTYHFNLQNGKWLWFDLWNWRNYPRRNCCSCRIFDKKKKRLRL